MLQVAIVTEYRPLQSKLPKDLMTPQAKLVPFSYINP